MVLTLAFDTSGKSEGIALLEDATPLGEIFSLQVSSHSETLLPGIDLILKKAGRELSAVGLFALTVGPGSFTGLRIGISTVKALCRAYERPVAPVSTLLALAEPHLRPGQTVIGCLDARLQEVFVAAYRRTEQGFIEERIPDQSLPLEKFLMMLGEIPGKKCLVGSGAALYAEKFRLLPDASVPAEDAAHAVSPLAVGRLGTAMARDGKALPCIEIKPRYLRLSEAENSLQRGLAINLA